MKIIKKSLLKIKNLSNKFVYQLTAQAFKKILNEQYPQLQDSIAAIHANLKFDRKQLIEARNSIDYEIPYTKKNPLVSVRIATYNRSNILLNKTLPSILNQSYKNIEVIIVGDHCTDDTEEKINKLKDKRVHFYNMPYRGYYPENDFHRWLVAGIPAANEAQQRTNGEWIVPFDDDDEMLPNHVEDLLKKVIADKLEFAYGKARSINIDTLDEKIIGVFPPRYGSFSLNTSIFHKNLKFFEYDPFSWTINEPGDWNLMKRLMLTGVYIGFIDKVVTKINFVHPLTKTGFNPELT